MFLTVAFAIGTPILNSLLSRFNKYPLMLILISFFIITNVLSALSYNYELLFLSRILMAIAEGVLVGGKIASKNGVSKLRYIFIFQAIILASLYLTAFSIYSAMISILLMSLLVFVQGSTSQMYSVELAEKHFPAARDLAASLTPVSINFGIAIGSAIGGLVVTNMGLIHVSWVGGIFALTASFVTFSSFRLNQKVKAKKS